ncbi:MAG: trehalose-phosphatase [Acidobacteria bacterium]|nr:trehalose-phosphatase [Acidobacteriota bacterium]
MRYLLSRASQSILTRLAQEKTLCAFDFDGTLSPIVGHPGRARMRARTRILLGHLAALYPCVIITGRAREDLIGKLGGAKVARVIGNHGAETEATVRRSSRRVERWKVALELELGPLPGVSVEDKGLSLAVHYRQSTQKAEARRRILAATRKLEQVRVFGGKQVVNLVVDSALHKGEALAVERDRLGCNWVLYVGDDENDEDAFALDGNIVPVRIGRKRRSHALYYLRTQAEIEKLLKLLVLLRASGVSRAVRRPE